MKNLSKTFLTINGIISVIASVMFGLAAISFFVLSFPFVTDFIAEAVETGAIYSSFPGTPLEVAGLIQFVFALMSFPFLLLMAFSIISSVLSFKAISKKCRNLYIANIIFGALSSSGGFGIAGAILGLIVLNRENRNCCDACSCK